MLETHPFPPFVPPHARYLLIGSFPGKLVSGNNWYYSSPKNQFWLILGQVYHTKLNTKKSKQQLFSRLHLAVTDIIYQCERRQGTNLDTNLINIIYNTPVIEKILTGNPIATIFLTSRFVETKFKKLFKGLPVTPITLPSPSPRYAKLTLEEKVKTYSRLLPMIK